MSLHAGARLMRLQPPLVHPSLRYRTSSASALTLRILPSSQANPHAHVAAQTRGFIHTNNALRIHSRKASTFSTSPPSPSVPATISDPLNPPASTRPPPLDLPVRDADTQLFTHLFRLGKAYTTFYKAGIKAVFTNRRLLRDLPDTPPPHLPSPSTSTRGSTSTSTAPPPSSSSSSPLSSPTLDKSANPTRSTLLLRARVRHDIARLPLFGLIVLICGEFTPLIVLLFPRLTPYTCRIPTQANVIRRGIEARRAASFRSLDHVDQTQTALTKVADGHICRSLGLGSAIWDKMGFSVPFARARAADVVSRIVQDDALLLRHAGGGGGGAEKLKLELVDDEVVLACEERGIDTLDKDVSELRGRLADWLIKSMPAEKGDAEARMREATGKVRGLLLGLDRPI
ncbi:hypothetical protein F5Y08DRAFT_28217 [Xylaria arbuscula]|nr:hypothetical protein F5Y08DRAFT_28217 [Xylaria arbuscula]